MSNDRNKLLTIINNLELDYRSGNISKDKYDYLIKEYNRRLDEVTLNEQINNANKNGNLRDAFKESQLEDEELINRFIVRNNKPKKEKKSINRGLIITVATLALLVAFIGGMGFGVFNFDFNPDAMAIFGQVSISDTAFPVVVPNITVNTTNYTSSKIDYNYTDYSNSSDDSYSSDSDYDDGEDAGTTDYQSSRHSSNSNSRNYGTSSSSSNGYSSSSGSNRRSSGTY